MTQQVPKQKSRELEVKKQVDLLFQTVTSYSKSQEFMSLLQFCAEQRHLSPYNAMLVQMQRPQATYVLSAEEWKRKYNRVIKPHAHPLIILVPFGPVDFVFDIDDTEPVEKIFSDDPDALKRLIRKTDEEQQPACAHKLHRLITNLALHGVAFESNLLGGDELGAQIELTKQKKNICTTLGKKSSLRWDSYFLLSVNNRQGECRLFAAICQELSHLFCHHIPGYGWWTPRNSTLDLDAITFEARTVTWLVCERQGVENPVAESLETYLRHHTRIPPVSLDFILQAANEIEKMLKPMNYQKGLLYRKDEKFRDTVRREKERRQEELETTAAATETNYRQGELF